MKHELKIGGAPLDIADIPEGATIPHGLSATAINGYRALYANAKDLYIIITFDDEGDIFEILASKQGIELESHREIEIDHLVGTYNRVKEAKKKGLM
jgi:hypothetical protein